MRGRWIVACVLGEALGIAAVATTYAAIDRGLLQPGAMWILAAGAWEGLCLGGAQALILKSIGVRPWLWIALTVLGAVVGYALSLFGGAGADGIARTSGHRQRGLTPISCPKENNERSPVVGAFDLLKPHHRAGQEGFGILKIEIERGFRPHQTVAARGPKHRRIAVIGIVSRVPAHDAEQVGAGQRLLRGIDGMARDTALKDNATARQVVGRGRNNRPWDTKEDGRQTSCDRPARHLNR